ncbi:TPM domain-containing protein [Edaphobacter bradus]|uniref:TPM domain-containing protein n=1 Tax=Edaphobacter bradus TaxID=2259016 RepID=UPI0021E0037E|nr:TPM domain-containing protein [Edaphobacter bradus]
MKTILRWLTVILFLLVPVASLSAESVSSLPAPTGYVNDFAGVLNPTTKQNLEVLCTQVDRQAQAQIAVVTIKTLDNDQSIEEFATELEDKWKVGTKGTDRGVLMIFVMTPRRGRIEVGYGLEGILNDAKVGDIGRSMSPAVRQGDYNTAIPLGVRQIAGVIAQDAGVTLTLPTHQYHREPVQHGPIQLSLTEIVLGGGVILLILFFLVSTGNTGLIFFLLGNLMGGGGGGDRRRDNDGGDFGGFGGGGSGGGGASGDW